MSESMLGAPAPNGVGQAGFPRSLPRRRHPSCGWSGHGWVGSLRPPVTLLGLGTAMPHTITVVGWGRWCPTPSRVAVGAPSDHEARGLVPGGLVSYGGGGLLPVPGAPPGGVGGVDGDDRDALFGGQ